MRTLYAALICQVTALTLLRADLVLTGFSEGWGELIVCLFPIESRMLKKPFLAGPGWSSFLCEWQTPIAVNGWNSSYWQSCHGQLEPLSLPPRFTHAELGKGTTAWILIHVNVEHGLWGQAAWVWIPTSFIPCIVSVLLYRFLCIRGNQPTSQEAWND